MSHSVSGGSFSSFDLRLGTLRDIPEMADLAAQNGRDREKSAYECHRVLRERFGFSVVMRRRSVSGDSLVAFTNAALLRPHLGKRIRSDGVPFGAILSEGDARLFASEAEVGRANAGAGSDLFVTHFQLERGASAEPPARVVTSLLLGFVERFVGNRVRAIFFEARGTEQARRLEQSGLLTIETYDEWYRASGGSESTRPILTRCDLATATTRRNVVSARLLSYSPPTLRFPPGAREILRCAYLGYSDARIVAELGLTTASLNSRWTRILDTTERRMPELFARGAGGRGRDRQPLLNHIRNHPEEMWPYEPRRNG